MGSFTSKKFLGVVLIGPKNIRIHLFAIFLIAVHKKLNQPRKTNDTLGTEVAFAYNNGPKALSQIALGHFTWRLSNKTNRSLIKQAC